MGKSLVIVESPAKARTIAGYLGSEFAVHSSVGHVRDLPDRASDVPEAQRKRFGALGVDVNEGFEPYYVVDPGKKKIVSELKKHLADADELLLATDEDREGEAIAWHLVQVLKPEGAGPAHGLPRDHEGRDQPRSDRDARNRRQARRRPGDAADPRPPLRVRGLARPLEEGDARALGRSRPVGRDTTRRATRARADGLPVGRVLGPAGDVRPRRVRRQARRARRLAHRPRKGLRSDRGASRRRRPRPRRGARDGARGPSGRSVVLRPVRRRAPVPAEASRAVPDCNAPARG